MDENSTRKRKETNIRKAVEATTGIGSSLLQRFVVVIHSSSLECSLYQKNARRRLENVEICLFI